MEQRIMSRQEKRTRMRLVPPKLQLRGHDALTGSYPTNVRFSLDGRTGNYKVDYNDQYSVVFTSSNNYIPAIGFPVGNIWLTNSSSNDLGASIVTTGSIRPRIIDPLPFFHFSPGQEMQPFHDQQQFAADAKGAPVQNPFFATGSAETLVGEGFNSPLWSKNKIEIPIPVASNTELNSRIGVAGTGLNSSDYSPMAYYNFTTNVWEKIGVGLELNVTSSIEDFFGYYPIGFGSGLFPNPNNILNSIQNIGFCTTGLGFPFHPKFHATSSQTLEMKNYITEPFILEKAILQMGNVSFDLGKLDSTLFSTPSNIISSSVATFFILNQRYNQAYNYNFYMNFGGINTDTVSTPIDYALTKNDYDTSKTTYVDTVRDVIGYSQIFSVAGFTPLEDIVLKAYSPLIGSQTASLANLLPITSNDILIRNQIPSYEGVKYFNIKPIFSMSMGSPVLSDANLYNNSFGGNFLELESAGPTYKLLGYNGYRNGLSVIQPTTRGLVNDLFASENLEPNITSILYSSIDFKPVYPSEKFRINPYILNPNDKLILGCQMPISSFPVTYVGLNIPGSESVFTIHETVTENYPAKLILYGSYIRENREYNDGTNQLLSSETIHEVIE